MQRHPQILGDTQDMSVIKTVKKQSHGTSVLEVLRKSPQTVSHKEEKSKNNKERENLWLLFCVLVTLSPVH